MKKIKRDKTVFNKKQAAMLKDLLLTVILKKVIQ